MNTKPIWIGGLLAVTLATLSGPAISQGDEGGGAMDPAKMAEMMKKWIAMNKPGEQHARLAGFIGTWDTETTMHWGPMVQTTKGTSEVTWAIKGKVLLHTTTGTMMGKSYTGIGMLGFDNFKKKHWSVWTDSMGTAILYSEGVDSPNKKVLVMYGPMDEPLTGEHDKTVKYVTRITDDDTHTFEIWDLAIGENGQMVMKIKYTRRKADK